MKTSLLKTILLSAAVIAAGCAKNGNTPEDPMLDVSPQNDIQFTAAAAEHHDITVDTNQASWDAESDQTWCKITNKTASGFRITADPNTATTAPAPAKVTVTAGSATPVVINVTQLAAVETGPLVEVIMFTYTVFDPSRRVLCVMKSDGTGIRMVHDSDDPADAEHPEISRGVLSRDGTKAVVQDIDYNLFTYDIAGKTLTKIGTAGETWAPDEAIWTPDGSRILYCNFTDEFNTTLETIRPDGSDIQPLTGAGYNFGRPNYTPDGSVIIASNMADKKYICSMSSDGTDIVKIIEAGTDEGVECAFPVTDSRILYFSIGESISLCSADIDGENIDVLETFDSQYIDCDYLSANSDGTVICYVLLDSNYDPHVFIRSLNSNTLGTAKGVPSGNYTRLKFGWIKQSLYDALPLLPSSEG